MALKISIIEDTVFLSVEFGGKCRDIGYKNHENGCLLEFRYDSKPLIFLENGNNLEIAIRDIQLLLDSKNSGILQKLSISLDKKCSEISGIAKFRKNFLKVQNFSMSFREETELLDFLPFFNPSSLKEIRLNIGRENVGKVFEFSEISKSDQWKNAKILALNTFFMMENLENFKEITMYLENISVDIILKFKKVFLTSASMEKAEISFYNFDEDEQLDEIFGEAVRHVPKIQWFLKILEDSQQILSIEMTFDRFSFSRIERKDVPENAVLSNS
ncbi:hypothetical protein B9Z55_004539 [Caenorhabditis nigoni]|uniref:DUF38 domain-containing protein n=5 Tax=Caenorhabditis nigoni TaxID=1611254 RepID=A0A2G5UXQ6_9PELO|nr:hypothetical protein B9Z55_004539 [Caenorhabditis nigoni]